MSLIDIWIPLHLWWTMLILYWNKRAVGDVNQIEPGVCFTAGAFDLRYSPPSNCILTVHKKTWKAGTEIWFTRANWRLISSVSKLHMRVTGRVEYAETRVVYPDISPLISCWLHFWSCLASEQIPSNFLGQPTLLLIFVTDMSRRTQLLFQSCFPDKSGSAIGSIQPISSCPRHPSQVIEG